MANLTERLEMRISKGGVDQLDTLKDEMGASSRGHTIRRLIADAFNKRCDHASE